MDTELKENNELAKLMKELEVDTKLNNANIREKALSVSTIRSKWLCYYMKERENYKRINKLKAKLLAQKVKSSNISVLKVKAESIASEDETISKLNKLGEYSKEIIDFIERAMLILADFGFSIKNAIEIFKLEQL